MATIGQIATRWVRDVRTDSPKYLSDNGSNVLVRADRLYSYGQHFELARWVKAQGDHDGFWLLNGDTYSVSTSRHQREVRSAVTKTGEQVLILPYTTLAIAGIDLDSIAPVDVTKDRQVPAPRTYPNLASVPDRFVTDGAVREFYLSDTYGAGDGPTITANTDGSYTHNATRHVLGESLFAANYSVRNRVDWTTTTGRALFLSAFDQQETRLHYFLCQLPDAAPGSSVLDAPTTVEQAFTDLRPAIVQAADAAGVQVSRQGDIFAVPSGMTTRQLRECANGAAIVKAGRLLGTSHTATEVIETQDGTYARGILTHRPEANQWGQARTAEHKRQPIGDRKTWHVIVKNTVPVDAAGQNRAWSRVGNVD